MLKIIKTLVLYSWDDKLLPSEWWDFFHFSPTNQPLPGEGNMEFNKEDMDVPRNIWNSSTDD